MGDYTMLCYAMGDYTMICYVFTICTCSWVMPCYLLPLSLATNDYHHSLHKVSANNPILQPILRYHQQFCPTMTSISLLYFAVIMISLSLSLYLSLSTHTYTHTVSTRAGKSPWKAPSTAGFDMMSERENVVFAFSEASGWTPYMEDR